MRKPNWIHIPQFIRRLTRWDGFWWISGIAVVLLIGGTLSWWFWEDLRGDQDSLSTTVRNVALVIGGLVAMLLAVWRSRVAERQTAIAQQGLLNERYQKGAEMLGNPVLSVRLGGIFALQRLAEEHPERYHIQVMELFCAFARYPTKGNWRESYLELDQEQEEEPRILRGDVQSVMQAIGSRSRELVSLERRENFRLYLRDADLSGLQVLATNLSFARLTNANLSNARLRRADLSSARLRRTILSGANLDGSDLSNANLSGADLSGTIFGETSRLTQIQLDQAKADPGNPPKLDGVLDAETGKQLVWRGAAVDP